MSEFSKMNNNERKKMCDTLGVTNLYTGYRHNLNRGNLDPVRLGYAWLDQQPNKPPYPKWTPEPKWTPPCTRNTSPEYRCVSVKQPEPFNCNQNSLFPTKVEIQLPPPCNVTKVEPNPGCCATTKTAVNFTQVECNLNDIPNPGPSNLKSEPPCECDTKFKPLPKFTPQFGCEKEPTLELPVPRPQSQPKCEYPQVTKSLSVTKCVPVPRAKSVEKGCCNMVSNLTPPFLCGNRQPEVDLCDYLRKPRRECYIKNGGGRKADLDSFVTPENYFRPQPSVRRPGYKKTVKIVNPRPTEGTIQSLHVRHSGVTMNKGKPTATIQERFGINMTYPGKTEYKDRYQTPKGPTKTLDFTINPKLDFSIHGRPLDTKGKIPKVTEYQYRYEWPDGSKIRQLPWLCK